MINRFLGLFKKKNLNSDCDKQIQFIVGDEVKLKSDIWAWDPQKMLHMVAQAGDTGRVVEVFKPEKTEIFYAKVLMNHTEEIETFNFHSLDYEV